VGWVVFLLWLVGGWGGVVVGGWVLGVGGGWVVGDGWRVEDE
jgi:hypothetical protein